MPLTVFTQRNFVADFLPEKCDAILEGKRPCCVLKPPLADLGSMYNNHLRFIGKCVEDLLLVLTELFSPGVMAEALRAIIG